MRRDLQEAVAGAAEEEGEEEVVQEVEVVVLEVDKEGGTGTSKEEVVVSEGEDMKCHSDRGASLVAFGISLHGLLA